MENPVMPNHVHLLAIPAVPLSQLVKSIKGFTQNGRTRCCALQVGRFGKGLVKAAEEYRWSSAGGLTGRSAAGQEARPTLKSLLGKI
jgi:REP element-mobilizing transposase RayT